MSDSYSEVQDTPLKVKISLSKLNYKAKSSENGEDESDVEISESQHQIYLTIKEIHKIIVKKDPMNIFANPVTDDIAPGYSQIISNPIDLGKILQNINKKNFYKTVCEYQDDLFLMCKNCMKYNTPDTIFYQKAYRMMSFIRKQLTLNKINKLRHTIGYSTNLTSDQFGEHGSSSNSTSKRSTSPSSSECSEEITMKKKFKVSHNESKTVDEILENDSICSENSKTKLSEEMIKMTKKSINQPSCSNQKIKIEKVVKNISLTDSLTIPSPTGSPQLDEDKVDLEEIKKNHDLVLEKKLPDFGFLSLDQESIGVEMISDTQIRKKVNYSSFVSTFLREKNYKKAFETIINPSDDYLEKIESLKKLNTTPKEPIGFNIHGPLKIFEENHLMNLLSIYGGDGQCLEYVLSLLKFANPIGSWALDSCEEKLNTVTDGLHSSLAHYILKDEQVNMIPNSNESFLKLLL